MEIYRNGVFKEVTKEKFEKVYKGKGYVEYKAPKPKPVPKKAVK